MTKSFDKWEPMKSNQWRMVEGTGADFEKIKGDEEAYDIIEHWDDNDDLDDSDCETDTLERNGFKINEDGAISADLNEHQINKKELNVDIIDIKNGIQDNEVAKTLSDDFKRRLCPQEDRYLEDYR